MDFSGTGISEELLSPRLSGELLMIQTTLEKWLKSRGVSFYPPFSV